MRGAVGMLAIALAWLGWATWGLSRRIDAIDAETDKELNDLHELVADRALDAVRLVTAVTRLKQSVDRMTSPEIVFRAPGSRNGGTQC